jgi:hypothetical protein
MPAAAPAAAIRRRLGAGWFGGTLAASIRVMRWPRLVSSIRSPVEAWARRATALSYCTRIFS